MVLFSFLHVSSSVTVSHCLVHFKASMTPQDPNLHRNFRCTVLNLCVKQHRISVLVQGTVFALSQVHFAVPIQSSDREKPLKKLAICAFKYLTTRAPCVTYSRAFRHAIQGFFRFLFTVINVHKTDNSVLYSVVIKIFHGKSNV